MEIKKNKSEELILKLQEILIDTKMAGIYVEDGKEVRANRQIQGVRTKLVNLINWTKEFLKDDVVISDN